MTNKNTPAVAKPSNAQLMEMGFLPKNAGGTESNRIAIKGTNVFFDKEVIASYNPMTKEPALYVQLTDAPVEYQMMWFTPELAEAVGRDGSVEGVPSIANRPCKSHFDDPNEARKFAEDGTSCKTCPVHPFKSYAELPKVAKEQDGASKCAWKGDLEFRILEKTEDGFSSEDQTVYTYSLPQTAMIEFKGSSSQRNDPLAGAVSAHHFMYKLAMLGMEKWGEEGLGKARAALSMGGVIAALHIPLKDTPDGSKTYPIASFEPIDILEMEEQAALPESAKDDTGTVETDDVPF